MYGSRTTRPAQDQFRHEPIERDLDGLDQAYHHTLPREENRRVSSSHIETLDDLEGTVRINTRQKN